ATRSGGRGCWWGGRVVGNASLPVRHPDRVTPARVGGAVGDDHRRSHGPPERTGAPMSAPGPTAPTPPGTPEGAWAPPQGAPQGAAPQKSGVKKWLPIGGAVLAAGVVGVGSLTGWFGVGDPKVDDCVRMVGEA